MSFEFSLHMTKNDMRSKAEKRVENLKMFHSLRLSTHLIVVSAYQIPRFSLERYSCCSHDLQDWSGFDIVGKFQIQAESHVTRAKYQRNFVFAIKSRILLVEWAKKRFLVINWMNLPSLTPAPTALWMAQKRMWWFQSRDIQLYKISLHIPLRLSPKLMHSSTKWKWKTWQSRRRMKK